MKPPLWELRKVEYFRILIFTHFRFFLVFCFFAIQQLNAQLPLIQFKKVQDLQSVKTILQDKDGLMWFGSSDGLYRYDGYQLKHYKYDPRDSTGLSDNDVLTIYEDRAGVLWICTLEGGLNRFDKKTETFKVYKTDSTNQQSISSNVIYDIIQDKQGMFWVATGEGLNRFDAKTGKFYRFGKKDGLSPNITVLRLLEDKQGMIWFGMNSYGMGRYNPSDRKITFFVYQHPDKTASFRGNVIRHLFESKKGELWIASYGGLHKLDRQTGQFTHYDHDPKDSSSLSHQSLWRIGEDDSGKLWIATYGGGLNYFDPATGRSIRYTPQKDSKGGISVINLFTLYLDRSGLLWVGLAVAHVEYAQTGFQHILVHPYAKDESLTIPTKTNAYIDSNGILWVGTQNYGLFKIDKGGQKVTRYLYDAANPQSISGNNISAILEDRFGNFWVATEGYGLNLMDREKESFRRFASDLKFTSKGLNHNAIHYLYEDPADFLWIATSSGLSRMDLKDFSILSWVLPYKRDKNPGIANMKCAKVDSKKNVWVGTSKGLIRLDREMKNYKLYEANPKRRNWLVDNEIWQIYEDKKGRLWLSSEQGLHLFDPQKESFRLFNQKSGLPQDRVFNINEDKEGNLWARCGYSLVRFDEKKENFLSYPLPFQESFIFLKDNKGDFLLAGEKSWMTLDLKKFKNRNFVPPIIVTSFKIFGKEYKTETPLAELKNIRLDYHQDFFSFEFAALDYAAPEQNQYAYKMEGFDKDWVYSGNRRYAAYTNLPAGTYTFRVKASNSDGIWNEKGISLQVIISPPYWQTWWFRTALLALVAGILYALHRYRTYYLRAINKLQKETLKLVMDSQEEVRERISGNLHDSIGSMLAALRMQLVQIKNEENQNREKYGTVLNHLDETIGELRQISHTLAPSYLIRYGLKEAVQKLTENLTGQEGLKVQCFINGLEGRLHPSIELFLYRATQELTQNVLKHANAKKMTIYLTKHKNDINLMVEDDGTGFEMESALEKEGLGFSNIQKQVALLQGKLWVDSSKEKGSVVSINLPVQLEIPDLSK